MVHNLVVQKTVIRHRDGSYLILRRSATDPRKPLAWDLPGGLLDPGESLDAGALREVYEEVGLQPIDMTPRYSMCKFIEEDNKHKNYIQVIYVASSDTKEVVLSYEHDVYEWVDAAEFTKRFASQPRYHKAVRYIIDNKLDLLA